MSARVVGVACGVVLVGAVLVPGGADAAGSPVDARDVVLSSSASCAQGDVEIEYTAVGVERQLTTFSAAGGQVLHAYDVAVYSPTHDGVEYVLSQTSKPPAAGTVVGVRVTVGSSPPDQSSGEFFLAYRCDSRTNDEGGANVVLAVCAGPLGTCPATVDEYLEVTGGGGSGGPALVPGFTG